VLKASQKSLTFEEFLKSLLNKKVAVLGAGISNVPLIKYLSGKGVFMTVFDKCAYEEIKKTADDLQGKNIDWRLGKDYLKHLTGFDIIFKSPQIRTDIPELLSEKAIGAEITSEMEEFVRFCPAKIFGITGSVGKTTTTTIIYNILKKHGYKCRLGGNIGMPLFDNLEEISPEEIIILELSSFQLQTMSRSPEVAVITNISPNHLDVHKSLDEYISSKKNIYRYQNRKGRLVLNYNNLVTREMAEETKGEIVFFSIEGEPEISKLLKIRDNVSSVYLDKRQVFYKKHGDIEKILDSSDIILPGKHNTENYLAAIAAVHGYVDQCDIYTVASGFKGVEHRIEQVRDINGVTFYNDSKATTPKSTIAALKSFDKKIILIAGGKDKNSSYEELAKTIIEKVKYLVLIGENTPLIESAITEEIKDSKFSETEKPCIYKSLSYDDAVKNAYAKAAEGDVVILSPAGTSYDMFKNFEERGDLFKKIVNNL
jgi:UDP-N-acetylmuramoylalanine--D-glutamate ligase